MPPSTIVVPLDGSPFAERALPAATALADRLDADLLLVSAPWDPDRDVIREYLSTIAAETRGRAVDTLVTDDRRPADTIVAAGGDPARLVCMTTHGRGRLRWATLGSVAEEVIGRSERPVLLVGRRCRAEPLATSGPIVVGVDGSEISEQVVPPACEWAKALDCDVALVFVIHPLDVEDAEHPETVLEAFADRVRAEGLGVDVVVTRSSYPAGALVDVAETLAASLVAMATHARSGLARVVLGSVTMGVLGFSPCPVLVVHPR